MSGIWTRAFWKDTAERVVSAFALSLLGVFGTVQAADLHSVRWGQILTAAGLTAGITLIKCVVAGTGVVGQKGSPSLVAPVAKPDPAAGERLAEPSNVKVGGFTGGGQSGLLPPPTTRATGTVKLGDAGASTAPPD